MSGSISINVDKKINPSERLGVKCAKFFIGPVKNSHDETATTRWNDKVKEAELCGIMAMVIGASMAIVASGLMAGFSFLLIPTAVFMAFGVAAFLYGTVLTVIGNIGKVDEPNENSLENPYANYGFPDLDASVTPYEPHENFVLDLSVNPYAKYDSPAQEMPANSENPTSESSANHSLESNLDNAAKSTADAASVGGQESMDLGEELRRKVIVRLKSDHGNIGEDIDKARQKRIDKIKANMGTNSLLETIKRRNGGDSFA